MARPRKVKTNTNNTNNINNLNQNQQHEENQLNDKFYIPRNYARSNIQPLWATKPMNSTSKKYTSEQINKMLLNPYISYKELQNVSNYLLYNSPMYNNFLDYSSNLLTWDYVINCEDVDSINKTTAKNRYYESSKTIYKINVKTVFPTLLKRVLINGECYFYHSDSGGNSIITEIDSAICQLAQIDENNIWRYYINVSLINSLKLCEYPKEIQDYYQDWIDGGKKKDRKIVDGIEMPKYIYLVSNKGFAMFSHIKKTQHDYPYFASLFEDLNNLESDKDYMSEYIKESNTKLIHMKVPTDKDSGLPLMPKEIIETYHSSAKEHLPSNVAPLTNPFEVEGIALDSSQKTAINLVEHSTKVVSQDSGISDSIFNASSTLGLKYSTLADASKLYPILYYFENFLNLQIKTYKCKVKFLKINQFNQLEWHERYYSDLLAGGSRSLFAVTSGVELYDIINLAKTEEVLGFDDLLKPKVNASQVSGSELTSKNGRPEKDEDDASDSTNTEKEYR